MTQDPIHQDAFVAASVISFDHSALTGRVIKSEGRFAWTSDQAVADAEVLARLIMAKDDLAGAAP